MTEIIITETTDPNRNNSVDQSHIPIQNFSMILVIIFIFILILRSCRFVENQVQSLELMSVDLKEKIYQ